MNALQNGRTAILGPYSVSINNQDCALCAIYDRKTVSISKQHMEVIQS